ncbi:MAG: LytTR family transcriptional regulator DNA-binding domain-containing protein [Thermoanaerobaculales bacterium]|nr:LytTR family transcriptional regulator DNA-binding domain-containing protein [Thermoanaerobaculales bacterium]
MHLEDGRRVPMEPGEVPARFPEGTMVQVHHSYAVNPDRVSEVRRRERRRDWELKLEPPVNRVIPVGRSHLAALWAVYGEV